MLAPPAIPTGAEAVALRHHSHTHMKTRIASFLAAAAGAALLAPAAERGAERLNRLSDPAPQAAIAGVLQEALAGPEGEYAALATYDAIIAKFGEIAPYTMIRRAEQRHIAALQRQFETHGLPVPENPWTGRVATPASLLAAAQEGVRAEEENVRMYDRLIARAAADPAVTRVLTHLQAASRDRHLPAFRRAAAQGGAGGCGVGAEPGAGRGLGRGGAGCGGGCGLGPAWRQGNDPSATPGNGRGRGGNGRGAGGPPWRGGQSEGATR